ncbi:MAG: hypothetical protein RIQ72_400 [Candidatus Parcubacteria bacterium]|jgi:hypothetical protein
MKIKTFLRIILLVLVSLLGVSCAGGPGYGQGPRRGGPPMSGPGNYQSGPQTRNQSMGDWYAVADGKYTHYRVSHNKVTGEIITTNMGVVPNDDPGLVAWAKRVGHRIKNKGDSTRVSIDEVPADIRAKILATQRQHGAARAGGILPPRSGRVQGGYPQAPPCNGGFCPPQGVGPQGRQAPPAQYDSFGRIPQYVPAIPRGMKAWDAHQRGYW